MKKRLLFAVFLVVVIGISFVSAEDDSPSCTAGSRDVKEIEKGEAKRVAGLRIGVYAADETNFRLATSLLLEASAFTLNNDTNTSSSKEIEVHDENYVVRLDSATQESVMVTITKGGSGGSEEIEEGEKKEVLGLEVFVMNIEADSTSVSATIMAGIESLSLSTDGDISKVVVINNNTFTLELVSASDNGATIRVICGKEEAVCAVPVCDNGEAVDTGEVDESGCALYECLIVCPEISCPDGTLIHTSEVNENDCVIYECQVNETVEETADEETETQEEHCSPLGYREPGTYCSADGAFIPQRGTGELCEDDFECESNVCLDDECVSGGLLWRIINWFKKLFG